MTVTSTANTNYYPNYNTLNNHFKHEEPKQLQTESKCEHTDMIHRELERMRQQGEAVAGKKDDFGKALKIAARIMNGDVVADKDDKFLLDNYPDLHMQAWLMRRVNENPKEYKSVLDEDSDALLTEFEFPSIDLDIPTD
jgi:adenylate kinase family enzyme